MAKVWLDAGHGGYDPGAVSGSLIEKDMTLVTTLAASAELRKYGVEVGLSRSTDEFVDIMTRPSMANNWGADYFVSIHYNAGGGDGEECICSAFHGDADEVLAYNILARISKETGQNTRPKPVYTQLNSRGTDYFGVIRGANMPPIIIEAAFIDSSDANIVDTNAEQQQVGIAIAHGILDTLHVSSVGGGSSPSVQPTPSPVKTLRKGDISTDVIDLQNKLIKLGYSIPADGSFGPLTDGAVRQFQLKYLGASSVDGVVGPITKAKINEVLGSVNSSSGITSSDKVSRYQSLVNQLGIRDKNGNPLSVDGGVGDLTRSTYAKMPVLYTGARGVAVSFVQNIVGASPVDGAFGRITLGKVQDYQRAHGVADDGVVGQNTYRVLVEE